MSDPSKFLVKDADTVDVRATGERLRFQGLNSPEKDTAAGPAATAFTQSVVEDYKNVQRQGYDYYGRTVADLTNDQGESLNARLIREGQAPAANFDRGPYPYASTLRQQTREQAARTSPQPQFQASEATQIAQQRYAEAAPNKQKPLGVEFGDALKRGVDQTQAAYGAAWAALGDFFADNSNGRDPLGQNEKYNTLRDNITNAMQRSGMKMYRRNVEEAKQYGQSTRLSEVDDVSSGLRWAFGVLGENLPGIVDTALSAVAGGVVGAALKKTALGVAERKFKSAARKRALEMGRTAAEAERFARRADLALWGARAGAFTASGAQITGDTYANIFNETGVRAPGRALAAGAAGGALEVLGLETVLRRVLPSAQGADGVIKAAASAAGVGAAVEGSTEAAQEVLQAIAEESAHPDWDGTAEGLAERVFSPERRAGYLEAAAAGALFGGLFGGAGGGVSAGINKLGGSSNENEDTTSGDNTAPPPPDRESTNAQTADVSPPAESGPTPDSAGSATQGRESSDPPPVRPVVRALAGAPPDTEQSPPSTLQADQSTLAGDQDAHADNQSSSQTSEPPITVDDVLQAFPEGRVTPGAIRTKFGGLRVSLEQARALAEGVETAREQKAASTQPSTQANEVVAEPDAQAGVAQDSTESAPAADAEQVNRAPTVGEMSEALKDIDHPRVEDVLRLFPDVTPAQAKKYLEHVTLQRSAKRAEQTIRQDKKKVRTPETKAAPAAKAPETKATPPPTPGEVHAVFASQDKVTAEDVRKAFPQLTPKEAKQHRDTIMAARAAEAQATTAPATDATQTDTQQSASPPAQQEVAAPTAPNAKLQSAATAPPSPARTDASKTPTAGANQSPVSSAKAPSEDSQTIQEPTASGNKEPANTKVVLPKRNKYHAKDQAKADKANKFIGRGSEKSSTAAYGQAYGDNANSGTYTADDTVFVSAEGARKNRVAPDLQELSRAMDAGATIITDDADNRSRPYNVGEREVATHLATNGYVETAPGTWKPDPKQASTESTQDVDDGVYKTVVQEDYSDLTSPETMLDLYRRAKSEQARVAAIPESERTDRQDTLHSSLNEFFGSLMDHRTNLSEMPGFYDLPDAEQDRLFGELQRVVDSKAAPAPKAPKQNAATTSTKVLDVPAKESTPAESKPEQSKKATPEDAKAFAQEVKDTAKNGQDLLDLIIRRAPKRLQEIAVRLRGGLDLSDVALRYAPLGDRMAMAARKSLGGKLDVTIAPDATEQLLGSSRGPIGVFEAYIHEITHAAVYKILGGDGGLAHVLTPFPEGATYESYTPAQKLHAIGLELLAAMDATPHIFTEKEIASVREGSAADANPDEVLAEGFTGRHYQSALSKVPSLDTSSERNSAWDDFVALIKSLLRLKNNEVSALDDVLRVGAELLFTPDKPTKDATTKAPSGVSPSKQKTSSTKNQALSESAPNPAPPASTASQRISVSIGKEGKKPVTPGALANATDEAPPPREAKPVPETVARARKEVEAAKNTLQVESDKARKVDEEIRRLSELQSRLDGRTSGPKLDFSVTGYPRTYLEVRGEIAPDADETRARPKALAAVSKQLAAAIKERSRRKERVKEAEEALDEAEANLKNAVAESRGLTRHNDTAESGDVELDTAGPRDDVEVTQTGEDVDPDTSVDEYESGISARDVNPLAGTLQPIRRVGDRGTNPSENWETYDERHPSMPKVRELIGNSDNLAVPVADVLDSPLFKALPAALRAPIADLVLRRFDAGIDSEIMFEVKEKDDGFLQVRVRERLPSDIAFRDTGFDVSTGLPMLAQDVLENEVQRMRDRANGKYGDKLVSPERIGFQAVIPADHPVVLFMQQVLDRVGSPDKALKVLLEMDQFKAMREYIVRTFGAANSTKGLLKLITDIHSGPGKTGWTAPERVTTTATNRVAVRSSRTSEAGVIVSSSTIWLNDFDIMALGRRMIKNAEGGTKDFMDQVALYQLGLSMLMGRGVSLRPRDVDKALSPTARLAPGVNIASASQRAQQANRLAPRVQAQEMWLREMYELMDGWHAGTVSSSELLRRLFVLEAGGPFTSLQHLFTGRKNIPSEEREAGGVYVEDPETGEKVFQPRRIPPASYYEGLTRLKARLTEEAKASPDPDKKGLFRQLIEREAEAALAAWHKFFTSDSYMLSRMTPDDTRGKRNRMQFGYFGNVGRTVAEIESDTLHRLDTNNDGTPLDLTEIQGENEVDTADPDIRQKQQQDSERPAYDPTGGRGGTPKLPDRPTSKLPEPTSSGKENITTPLSAKGKPAPRAAGAVESAAKRQGALPPSVTNTLLVDAVPLGTTSPIGRLLQPVAKLLGIDKLPIHIHTKDSQSLIKLRDTLRDMGASKAADEIGAHVRARSLNFTVFVEGQAFIFLDPAVFGQNKIDLVNKAVPDKAWNKNQRKIAFHELGHVFLEAKLGEEELRHGPLWRKILQAAGPESPKEWAANQLITWAEGKRPAKLEDTWVARLHALLRRAAKLLGFGKKPEFDNLMHEVYTTAAYSELVSGRFTTGNGAINLSDAKDLFTKRKGPLDINALIPELVKGRYDKLDAAMSDVGGQSVISYLVNDRGFTAPATLRNTPDFRVEDWTPPMADAVRRSAAYRTTASFANVMRETGGYLHDRITKTADSWLRTQRNAEGDSIPAIVAVADIFRAASGKARQDVRVSDVLRFNFESDRTYDEPFFPAVSRMYGTAIENQLVGAVKGLSEEQAKAMRRDLQTGRLNTREARHVRAWLDNMWSYASGGIHNLGKIERNYFPRVFDSSKIDADPEAFIAVLRRYNFSRAGAEQVIELLRGEKGVVDLAVLGDVLATGAPSTKSRGDKLKKVPDIELEPFMVDDVVSILHRYAHTMIKRTEFERRFSGWVAPDGSYVDEAIVQSRISRDGNLYHFIMRGGDKVFVHRSSNAKYQAIRQAAVDQGASADQIANLDGHINAYLGRLGADMPPRARAAMSTMVAIQNWALLPLSLFSSIVDAGNTVLRTNGDLKSSWKGMQAAISAWKQKDRSMLYRMAVVNGKVVNSMQSDLASNYFDQPWLEGKAALWNERLFRINGMHWWSNFSRTYALATGEEFFKDLAQRNDAESRRLLAQFNLTPQEVKDWVASGMPRWTEGGDDNGSRKVQLALNRFAYESVLSPDATQRPKWASHPAAMMVWHLKQFAFSFYDVILRRMWAEVKDAPTIRKKAMLAILPALVLMPLAVAGTMLRDILRYNLPWQEEPKVEKEGFDAFMYAVSRAGILGPAQIMMDAYQAAEWGNNFVFALSGPTLNMFGELMFDQQHFSALTKILPVIPTLPTEREAIRSYLAELLEDARG